jgi:uncharacterized membrane protein
MGTLHDILLYLHIASGGLGLVAGTVNMVRRKGDKTHKQVGWAFSAGMLTAAGSALVLSLLNPNPFLFIVGVFTAYMVGTGLRYLKLKPGSKGGGARPIDWIISVLMLLAALAFLIWGGLLLWQSNSFGAVMLVFGLVSAGFVRADVQHYRGVKTEPSFWLLGHLQRMTGGFIAAATAFLVVNAGAIPLAIPSVVYWLLPTALLTPLINRWSRRYRASKA